MWEILIHRQKFPPPARPLHPFACDFTYYPHPYHDFPVITSHVHPRFIICNSGSKLEVNLLKWQTDYEARKNDLTKVQAIWNSWKRTVPTGGFIKKVSVDDSSDVKDDDSQKTTPRRVSRPTRPKRKFREEQHSPTPKSSKQQKPTDHDAWLDDETLHELDQRTSFYTNGAGFKKQMILDWLSIVSDSGCEVEAACGDVGLRDAQVYVVGA